MVPSWRGVPLLPCNKIPITDAAHELGHRDAHRRGQRGRHRAAPDGPARRGRARACRCASWASTRRPSSTTSSPTYFSAAVLVPDALGVLEDCQVGHLTGVAMATVEAMTEPRPSGAVLAWGRDRVDPALRAAVATLPPGVRRVAEFHLGLVRRSTATRRPRASGKAIRPTLALLSARGGRRHERGGAAGRGRGRARAQPLAAARRRHRRATSCAATGRPRGRSSASARRSSPATRC